MTATEYRRFMTSGPRAPADARQFVRAKLPDGDRLDDVILMVSELVTNAVRHGTGRIFLRLINDDVLRVEVQQLSKASLNGHQNARSGYGLKIVAELSDSWGTGDPEWAGVWFEVKID
ncbi:MAG TPA: ATP-binding protein [Acidimicrobiia bacterium]|nr:ATP-binding protein [Acidimicrobiia bacterium]